MLSPVTGSENVSLVKKLHKRVIVRDFKKKYGVDVDRFYDLVGEYLEIFQCEDTGYKFYYPENLAGDGQFYDSIIADDESQYYSQWKKEYEFAKQIAIKEEAAKILDVGCGSGKFVEAASKFSNAIGLEISDEAVRIGRQKNLDLRNEFLHDHAEEHPAEYDFVSAFQVLEHVPQVSTFLNQLIRCLKPGGHLIISVPNCEPYIMRNHWYGVANLPPHHMGLWNLNVFKKLTEYFPLKMMGSDFDLKFSSSKVCLSSSLSLTKHTFPGMGNGILKSMATVFAAAYIPYSYIVKGDCSTFGRVMVHFQKLG